MSSSKSKMELAKTALSAAGSIAAVAVVLRTIVQYYLPTELQDYLHIGLRNFFNRFSSDLTIVIDEFDSLAANEIYAAAEVYLSSKIAPATRRLKASKSDEDKGINVAMERNELVTDVFDGDVFKWVWVCRQVEDRDFYNPGDMNSTVRSEFRSFELIFHKKHEQKVLQSYLPHVLNEAQSMKQGRKALQIFTVDYPHIYNFQDLWTAVNLDHPTTFETLAMEPGLKNMIKTDLERFVRRKEYYRKVGKAWKRGYLLHGPPGTGKSSLIAAMANYLNFDIYDLELTELRCNSELRRLLVATANRSILVVEDIDCTIELADRADGGRASGSPEFENDQNKVTLSGLLNFVDGLWSSCGDERIIIFTTNHKEKLDPALLRPGRMDVHVHMSYCTPRGFKLLASNYLGLEDNVLYGEIEELLESTKVTPAEMAEQLLKGEEPNAALSGLIEFLHEKGNENEEGEDGFNPPH